MRCRFEATKTKRCVVGQTLAMRCRSATAHTDSGQRYRSVSPLCWPARHQRFRSGPNTFETWKQAVEAWKQAVETVILQIPEEERQ